MSDDRHDDELLAAGYTSKRGAIIFCAGLACLGAFLGGVFGTIGLNVLLGPENGDLNTILAATLAAVLAAAAGAMKVRHGNREAREAVQDAEWRREMREVGRPRR
ncbi:MAG: hypothetical protein WC807_17600 [Hyphomicrobium sp.]